MTVKGDPKFKGKLTRGLENDIKNFVKFNSSSQKSENLHFDGLLLSKAFKVLNEKVQKSDVSWHWRVIHKEKLILEKYGFLCDAIDLKQSVEVSLKV